MRIFYLLHKKMVAKKKPVKQPAKPSEPKAKKLPVWSVWTKMAEHDNEKQKNRKPVDDEWLNMEEIEISKESDATQYKAFLKWLKLQPGRRLLQGRIKKKMEELDHKIHHDFSWNRKTLSYSIDELEKKEYLMWKTLLEMPDDLLSRIDLIITPLHQ